MNNMKRNPFFLPSGFEPQEQINILEAKKDNKKRLDKIKERKRAERKLRKQARHNGEHGLICNKRKRPKNHAKSFHMQRGFDLAKEWGWDGVNRPYTPHIMSVFGGHKRR